MLNNKQAKHQPDTLSRQRAAWCSAACARCHFAFAAA